MYDNKLFSEKNPASSCRVIYFFIAVMIFVPDNFFFPSEGQVSVIDR